jgi:hypothetical protein
MVNQLVVQTFIRLPNSALWYREHHDSQTSLLRRCPERNRHQILACLASCWGVHMQPQPQKKLARAARIQGSIVLYRSAARSQFKAQKSLPRAEPRGNVVFGIPLFLRTLLRLVFVCIHRHKGPPVTLREPIPSNLSGRRPVSGRGSYITCLDCGQKFAYNHRTGRMVDFWGIHDPEALAGVRRRVDGLFSPFRGLAAAVGVNMRSSMSELAKSVHRLGVVTKGQEAKPRQ